MELSKEKGTICQSAYKVKETNRETQTPLLLLQHAGKADRIKTRALVGHGAEEVIRLFCLIYFLANLLILFDLVLVLIFFFM